MSEARKDIQADERDRRVLELWERLVEVEQRLIPTGLHVFGRAADREECADLLRAAPPSAPPGRGARARTALASKARDWGRNASLLKDKTEEGGRRRSRVEDIGREGVAVFMREGADEACRFLERELN